MTEEQQRDLTWLLELSDGCHRCLTCGRAILQAVQDPRWSIGGTTIDTNECSFVFDDMYNRDYSESIYTSERGNDRIYPNGLQTRDNGAGYWILECPYYVPYEPYTEKINYDDYIKSNRWAKKRFERLRIDNFQCAKCGSAKNLNVHHITYERLGEEEMNDLITLCNRCHQEVHSYDLAQRTNN